MRLMTETYLDRQATNRSGRSMIRTLVLLGVWMVYASASADELRVAVASNFKHAAKDLATAFELETDHEVVLLFGSTGKHAAQIKHGLIVDVFLAADSRRPQWLEQQGLAVRGSRFTYAVGRLVLWSPGASASGLEYLKTSDGGRIAIANPKLAPYGMAAQETLRGLNVYQDIKDRLVIGENVAQTYQFVKTGNAQAGLLAWSQVKGRDDQYWLVPADLHKPIRQQAVQIRKSAVAQAFLKFLQSEKALELIRHHGYDTP